MILVPQISTSCHDIMHSFGLCNTFNTNIHSVLIFFFFLSSLVRKKTPVVYHLTLFCIFKGEKYSDDSCKSSLAPSQTGGMYFNTTHTNQNRGLLSLSTPIFKCQNVLKQFLQMQCICLRFLSMLLLCLSQRLACEICGTVQGSILSLKMQLLKKLMLYEWTCPQSDGVYLFI